MGRIATLAGNVQSSAISRALVPFSLGSRIPGPKWALTKGLEGEKRSKGNERVLETSLVIGNTTCNSSVDSLMPRFVPLPMKTALNPYNLSFSDLFLIWKRNLGNIRVFVFFFFSIWAKIVLFSFAMKTRLIWNPDFKNNALRKGILFLDWDLIIVLTSYFALFEIEIFIQKKKIYIYIFP